MNARIQILLDSRDIEALAAEDDEVAGMWAKAVRTFRSATVAGLDDDPDSRFTLLYQAALQGATAVVRAAGYRVRGEHNHQTTFSTVAALGLGELSETARELNIIRQRRHAAVYDWEQTVTREQVDALHEAARQLLREGRGWIGRERLTLRDRLAGASETG